MRDTTVPDLYIDGAWAASGDGTCSPVVNPSDARPRHRGRRRDRRPGPGRDRGRPARLRRDRLAASADRRAGGAARPCRRADRSRPRGDGPARDDQHRQGDAREPLGHGRRRARLPLLRRSRRQGRRAPGRHRQPGRAQPHRLRAGRRVRADRPVELPAAPAELEDRAGPGRRQHRGDEAGPGDAADGDPPDPAARGGRASRPASSTSCSGRARASGRRWPTARTSTSSR